ncbi:MAG TPA: DUF4388 domain-containing protein [Thermomicrobiales bacterium]|nr:DUF4388 domain-containing protein [Thermomicrobiales bacterium]
MQGSLSEFTLAQLLQFFALAERSGTVVVKSAGRESRLLVEGDRIIGWGQDDYDVREPLLTCEMISPAELQAITDVQPRSDTPGLSFVVRNLIQPERWEFFAQRQLEQDIYPLLNAEEGDFEIQVLRNPPAPLRLSIPINSMILDGSRWESEMEAAALEGYQLESTWQRQHRQQASPAVQLSGLEWMVWAILTEPLSIAAIARRLCMPDLATIGAIKRLRSLNTIEEAG